VGKTVAGEIITDSKPEAKNPQVSVCLVGPVLNLSQQKEGLLAPYNSPVGASSFKGNLKDAEIVGPDLFRGDRFRQQHQLV